MTVRRTSDRLRLRNGRLSLTQGGPFTPAHPAEPTVLVSLADFDKDQRTYQHRGGSKAVPFSVTYTGGAPTQIQARTVDATSGAELTAWTTVNVSASGGTASGALSVAKGYPFHKLQVRTAADQANVLATVKSFRVGEVLLLIGQSNMVGLPNGTNSKYPLGSPNAMEYRANVFQRIGNVNDAFAPNTLFGAGGYGSYTTPGKNGDGYVYLGNLLAESFGCAVCLLEAGSGGTSIDQWMAGGNIWENSIKPAVAAAGGDFGTVIWYQGENDFNTASATYKARLSSLMGQCHTLAGRNASSLKFGVVSLGPVSLSSGYSGGSESKFGATRAAQVEWANATAGAFYVGGMHDTHTSDGVHIAGEGYFRAPRRWSKSVAAAHGIGASGAGPRIVSASRSGSVVTLTLAHTGGNALTDGTGGNGSALTGFQFKDASGNVLATTASSITSATTLQFTVTGTPATVSYAMGNAPHSSDPNVATTAPVLASCVYDNATYLNGVAAPFGLSAVGCPLQPCGPITIAGG